MASTFAPGFTTPSNYPPLPFVSLPPLTKLPATRVGVIVTATTHPTHLPQLGKAALP